MCLPKIWERQIYFVVFNHLKNACLHFVLHLAYSLFMAIKTLLFPEFLYKVIETK